MRKLFALTLVTLSLTAFASFAEEGSLKDHMKKIGDIFKTMGGSLSDTSKNTENADAAAQISALFKLTLEQTPEHLQDIPEAKRAEAFKSYQELIQQCIDLADQLAQAFANNDNATATKIYRQLKDLKSDGHDEFDP